MKSVFDKDLTTLGYDSPESPGGITFKTKEEAQDFIMDIFAELLRSASVKDFHQVKQNHNCYYLMWTFEDSKEAFYVRYCNE